MVIFTPNESNAGFFTKLYRRPCDAQSLTSISPSDFSYGASASSQRPCKQIGLSLAYRAHRYDDALGDFAIAQERLRGNALIDYRQMGLKFKLWMCDVYYNMYTPRFVFDANASEGHWQPQRQDTQNMRTSILPQPGTLPCTTLQHTASTAGWYRTALYYMYRAGALTASDLQFYVYSSQY
jgi:hypothetical protein